MTLLGLLLGWVLVAIVPASGQTPTAEPTESAEALCQKADELRVEVGGPFDADVAQVPKAEKAVRMYESALATWRATKRRADEAATLDKLVPLYQVVGLCDQAREADDRELALWQALGDMPAEAKVYLRRGFECHMRGAHSQAALWVDRAAETARRAGDVLLEIDAVENALAYYTVLGNTVAVSSYARRKVELAKLKELLYESVDSNPGTRIPVNWSDVEGSPIIAEYREYDGVMRMVLVSHATAPIKAFAIGCTSAYEGRIHVIREISGVSSPSTLAKPGEVILGMAPDASSPENGWSLERTGCGPTVQVAVVRVEFVDGSSWQAENKPASEPH